MSDRGRCLWMLACCLLIDHLVAAVEPAPDPWSREACVAYGLVHATDAQLAQLAVEDRSYGRGIARAQFDPRLDLTAGRDIDEEEFDGRATINQELPGAWQLRLQGSAREVRHTDDSVDEEADYHIRLTKTLLGGGSLRASLQEVYNAGIREALARNDAARTRRQLQRDISKRYLAVVRELRSLVIQERKVYNAERNLLLARERDRIIDITNAEVQLADAEDDVLAAKADIASAYDRLKRSMGFPVDGELRIMPDIDFAYAHEHTDPDQDFLQAITHHEDFLNLQLQMQQAHNSSRIRSEERWPDLSLFGQVGQNAAGEDYDFDSELQSAVGAEASWQIGRRADIGRWLQARTEEERLRWRWHDLQQSKLQEIREANRNLEEAVARIELAEQRLQARERLVTLYQDRYDNGEIDILELLRAQDNFESAKVTLLEARITYLELLADYRYTIGE